MGRKPGSVAPLRRIISADRVRLSRNFLRSCAHDLHRWVSGGVCGRVSAHCSYGGPRTAFGVPYFLDYLCEIQGERLWLQGVDGVSPASKSERIRRGSEFLRRRGSHQRDRRGLRGESERHSSPGVQCKIHGAAVAASAVVEHSNKFWNRGSISKGGSASA